MPLACLPCRDGKRRCDRSYPHCELCQRRQLHCEYPLARKERRRPAPKDQSTRALHLPTKTVSSTTTLKGDTVQSLATGSEFPAVLFSSPEVFRRAHIEIPRLEMTVPNDIMELVGDVSGIRAITDKYFTLVHPWWPIICKRRFYQLLLNPFSQRRPELYCLAISMKLMLLYSEETGHGLYSAAKHLHLELNIAGGFSIYVLHAGILITLYELGHSIYPSAFLSIGACARYLVALGINRNSLATFGDLSFDEVEEKRRAWWAILVLDRFTNLSDPARLAVIEDSDSDTLLPVVDKSWEQGTATPDDCVKIGNKPTILMGRFSRLAQATHLLAKTIRHVASYCENDMLWIKEAIQLRRTLLALVNLCDTEVRRRRVEFCNQVTVCYSSILLLEERLRSSFGSISNPAYKNNSLGGLSPEAAVVVEDVSEIAGRLTLEKDPYKIRHYMKDVPPFNIYMTYQTITTLMSYPMPDEALLKKTVELKELLGFYAVRWHCANTYLRIIETEELLRLSTVRY
ncbi:hypothetical protein F5884DRAFT_854586 [Xylogone sp. PMI_703]|nr:hypothetical protein F5884DRAFT_854586 [Xylogone sp. PMI_703]